MTWPHEFSAFTLKYGPTALTLIAFYVFENSIRYLSKKQKAYIEENMNLHSNFIKFC
jgi:hypothetical protein